MKNRSKDTSRPCLPGAAELILKLLIPEHDFENVIGIYEQSYLDMKNRKGIFAANLWLFFQLCPAVPAFLKFKLNGGMMIKNYIKIAVRTIREKKICSFTNILGLSLGFIFCILIYFYVAHELSFDRFHKNGDSLYRIIRINHNQDGSIKSRHHQFPMPMGPELVGYFPEIKYFTRHQGGEGIVSYKNIMFKEYIDMADSHFFDIFTFPFIFGDPQTAIEENYSVVLTKKYALKYFGKENPTGKTLTVRFGQNKKDYIVSGVIQDIPQNSTLQFNIIMNISNYADYWPYGGGNPLTFWRNFNARYYLLLKHGTSKQSVENHFPPFYSQYFSWFSERFNWEGEGNPFSIHLQKMKDIHFDPGLYGGTNPLIYNVLIGIALIVLSIASFNFINLSIGMSTARSTEIGIRKVLGAGKKQMIFQFWSESLIVSYISMAVGVLFAAFIFSQFVEFCDKQIKIQNFINPITAGVFLMLPFAVGILSGSYPALVMTNFNTLDTLKGKLKLRQKRIFTKSLIIIQFSLSIFLIITAVILNNQINFMLNKDIGFKKDGLIVIDILENQQSDMIVERFRNKVNQIPGVLGLTVSTTNFDDFSAYSSIKKDGKSFGFLDNSVDFDFVKTMGLKIIQGRDFSWEFASDRDAVLVNQKFIDALGIESPLGKTIGDPSEGFPSSLIIIGVVENFNFASLHNEIDPAIFHTHPGTWGYSYLLARISTGNISEQLKSLEGSWKEIQPEKPFAYKFLSDILESHYQAEKRWKGIIRMTSLLAIGIACMGIFGLTSITLNQRVKEIGIRKVMGAKFLQIIHLLVKNFIVLVGIANVIACPIAYYVASRWLQNFAYRIDIGIWVFIFSGIFSLFITFFTVSYLAIKAATANPVDSLRYE